MEPHIGPPECGIRLQHLLARPSSEACTVPSSADAQSVEAGSHLSPFVSIPVGPMYLEWAEMTATKFSSISFV